MAKRPLGNLVKDAAGDLERPTLTRGRGLAGMLSEEHVPTQPVQEPETQLVDNTTSTQMDMSPRVLDDNLVVRRRPKAINRSAKSFRLRDDLVHRVEVLAAMERRKIYEVVEEALELYLAARAEEQPG